jgi:hypothetical protein
VGDECATSDFTVVATNLLWCYDCDCSDDSEGIDRRPLRGEAEKGGDMVRVLIMSRAWEYRLSETQGMSHEEEESHCCSGDIPGNL